ncbi:MULTISPECIES: hypothetical protein [unclassified Rhizobium]|uniref:hypothetical protein n=1 Tax=unclassified Rhizobium TaxID=2613769 RepID=UPI001AD982F0|nr:MULTISPECIES: hypothetical protein [unclassified Rhizobium]MBO9097244.1 hypothetical protein [Rhizobium sp. L58/93]MBO9133904.1 hypothetical protein [Rhizobium sp. B209b/85]MBO9167483.1 hypothetical protein [Rhizobium sp. L245/93]MBO9183442.1 hypothetical protein [Rhizobium sp. E27B/91]QXZ83776.1 hypothetical protein J5287_17370 [Rhizobium sp. K1/93]
MSLSDDGIADSEEMRQPRGAMPRVMASLIVAFFAYLGLALGGGFATFASTETNNFSAAKGSQQPHYIAQRDNSRGVVAAERSAEPKASWHDGNAALLAFATPIHTFDYDAGCLPPLASSLSGPGNVRAYLARGPPAASA